MFAAAEGHADAVRSLINAGADAGAKNANGDTALTLAKKGQKADIARMLSEF